MSKFTEQFIARVQSTHKISKHSPKMGLYCNGDSVVYIYEQLKIEEVVCTSTSKGIQYNKLSRRARAEVLAYLTCDYRRSCTLTRWVFGNVVKYDLDTKGMYIDNETHSIYINTLDANAYVVKVMREMLHNQFILMKWVGNDLSVRFSTDECKVKERVMVGA